MQLTKSTFLLYLDCPKNFWLYNHKPELFEDIEESDFDKQLKEQGMEVEQWARKLYKEGKLAEGKAQIASNSRNDLKADK